jgi:hypothetical protein
MEKVTIKVDGMFRGVGAEKTKPMRRVTGLDELP